MVVLPRESVVIELDVPRGVSVMNVIERSRITERVPELALEECTLGVFGHACRPDRLVADGDRVEIYRPLTADPRTRRRRRATAAD